MKFTRLDWLTLRYPIVLFGLSLILATLLVGYAEGKKNAVDQALQSQQNQLNQAKQKYQSSGQEKETITKYLPMYQQLINDGFIGEERRIEWVDSLRTIHQQNRLFSISYTIGPQQDYTSPPLSSNLGSFKLERSIMKVEMPLLHEADLLTLLNGLLQTQRTPVITRQCDITRLTQIPSNTLTPNLQATCELDWLTLKEPSRSEGVIQ